MHVLPKHEPRLAARFLEQILLVNLVVHAVALVFTSSLLLPGSAVSSKRFFRR